MGARGPAPVPLKILEARGSKRAATRRQELTVPVAVPSCPAFITGEARLEWKRLTKELAAAGLIAKLDRTTLACLVNSWGEYRQLCEEIRAIEADLEKAPSAEAAARGKEVWHRRIERDRAAKKVVEIGQSFGLSPAARQRMQAVENESKPSTEGKGRFFQ